MEIIKNGTGIMVEKEEKFIALIWTKYQFNILLSLLRKQNISHSSVLLIICQKAFEQGVNSEDFYDKYIYSSEKASSIWQWLTIKKEINDLINLIDFNPSGLFLRNIDSAIGRVLLSKYSQARACLIEDGLGSYVERSYLGYTGGFKEIIKSILIRLYFGRFRLKIVAVQKSKTVKSGLFSVVDKWLDVPFIKLNLQKKDFLSEDTSAATMVSSKVIILEQPLWQIGYTDKMLVTAYQQLFDYVNQNFGYTENEIELKMHPSSDQHRVVQILSQTTAAKIKIIDPRYNLEEMIVYGDFSHVKLIIGFYSSGLYLAKALLNNEEIKVIAFADTNLDQQFGKFYQTLRSLGITTGKLQTNE